MELGHRLLKGLVTGGGTYAPNREALTDDTVIYVKVRDEIGQIVNV